MQIEHIAVWVENLETMRDFYIKYLGAASSGNYTNSKTNFSSYFLSFGENKTRIELMYYPDIKENNGRNCRMGIAHFAVSAGSKNTVDELTERLRADGYKIASEPRTTGDGYYESVILDPEGNFVEITV
ncbi:MAG: VOC family protein [Candidatus Symbiothrix sp.]|jgi:lactoylglutathione lyase|nr:VOC family protein [Candidatus Symbiothrix sp.]